MSKSGILIVGALIVGVAAYQIFGRIPSEALNVALGVMCGIGAMLPISVGLLIALTRQRRQVQEPDEWEISDPEPVRYAPQRAAQYANQVEQPTVQRIPQYAQHAPQMPQMAYQQQPPQQQPQIIVVTPQGQFAGGQFSQGQFPQGFQMPQWQQQPYPFMQEHANAVDAREWRIIGEE